MPSPTTAQLGEAIRRVRNSRGISQETLADEAGVHWTTLSMIERGIGNPTWKMLGTLADELGIEIADLARMASEMPAQPNGDLPD